MEEKDLRMKMEQFFDAELSMDEERELYRYLCENDVPAELRRDKEAIMALCGNEADYSMPAGAKERLEAFIDALPMDKSVDNDAANAVTNEGRRILKIQHFVLRGVAAAAVVAVMLGGFLLVNEHAVQQDTSETIAEIPEKDTFENPEEAMKCFKLAMGEVQFAMNTAKDNIKEIETTLRVLNIKQINSKI